MAGIMRRGAAVAKAASGSLSAGISWPCVRRQAISQLCFTPEPAAEVTLYVVRRDPGVPY